MLDLCTRSNPSAPATHNTQARHGNVSGLLSFYEPRHAGIAGRYSLRLLRTRATAIAATPIT